MPGRRCQIFLITAVVLEIYYPTILAGLCYADDVQMVKSLLNMHDWSLKAVFLPGAEKGSYYRPLLYLSFIMDRELWSMRESIMHLENILLHLANMTLVYHLALQLLPKLEKENSFLPVIASLCFALHPVNTESVNWISGRTDVMAGTFVLLSAIYVVKFKKEYKKCFLIISCLSLLLGMMSKEVAIAFLPGIFFLLTAKNDDRPIVLNSKKDFNLQKITMLFFIISIITIFSYYHFRSLAFTSYTSLMTKTVSFISNNPKETLFVCLKAFGFYMKKLYFPLPLNFTIKEVNPFYALLAVPILFLCLRIALRRTLISAIYTAGIFLIIPSFLIALGFIAWTPYAERYVYVSSPFIIIPSVFYLQKCLEPLRNKSLIKAGVSALFIIIAAVTLERNIYWMRTTASFKDVKDVIEKGFRR